MSIDRPVFVIGCPRSGTTLLTLMLSSHSRIAFPPETRFLLPVFRQHREFGDLREKRNRRRLARRVVRRKGTKFAHLGLDRTRVIKAIVNGPPTLGSALACRSGCTPPTAARPAGATSGPATSGTSRCSGRCSRTPRSCTSCATRATASARWPGCRGGRTAPRGALATWVHAVDCAAAARRQLPPDAFYELRYEDLVADPRAALTELCAFLGEDFEEAMLDHREVAAELPQRQRERWHQETQGAVWSRRVGTYSGVLTPAEVALVESAAGSRMRAAGLRPPGLRAGAPRAAAGLLARGDLAAAADPAALGAGPAARPAGRLSSRPRLTPTAPNGPHRPTGDRSATAPSSA